MSARISPQPVVLDDDWSPKKLLCDAKLSELLNLRLDYESSAIVSATALVERNSSNFSRALARKSMVWARDSLERLTIRLTLENVGIIAVMMTVIMPRAFTYYLIYPIFRLVFGTLYPAYASYKAVRTKNVKEYVKWMMYWIVFALFTCAEIFTDLFFSFWFPFYYEIKIILVLWLLSPATRGSSILYRRFVHPALCKRESEIDDAIARATEQGYSAVLQLGTKGVNYATTVLMQTAIKGGGGLVQQLKKSYSLSDLVGEKEDENRNTAHLSDEVDMSEPRRRERSGRRGYSPRRTQSSGNHMEMYFSEVDLEVRKSRSREPVGSLTNIKSSDDISSGYSSGEALQSQRNTTTNDNLVRTASVGSRNRTKPRTTTKSTKTPEVDEDEADEIIETAKQLATVSNPFSLLSVHQTLELLTFLSQNKSYVRMWQHQQNLSDSDDDSSTLKADPPRVQIEEVKSEKESSIDVRVSEENKQDRIDIDLHKINSDICSKKIDQLKELLQSANETVSAIVSSQEDLSRHIDGEISIVQKTSNTLEIRTSPSVSRNNSDSNLNQSERSGKYHKKPAPKAPEAHDDEEEVLEEKPVKATLVIKTGTVKTHSEAVEAVIKRRKKSTAKAAARESFSKFLTIPKNIFHNAFHKDKDDDARSVSSGSCDNIKAEVDVTNVLLHAANDGKKKSNDSGTYISLKSDSIDGDILEKDTEKNRGETVV